MRTGPIPKDLPTRFWQHVTPRGGDECWEWQGRRDEGYGLIRVGGSGTRMVVAHRVSWEIHNGPIPKGKFVLHRCDNKPCCNPGHLFLGTHQDNMDDRNKKKRQARGERHGSAKLTAKNIRAIRRDDRKLREIAEDYNVSMNVISGIKRRATWRHVR
jgi:hypothetical protein